MPLIDSLRARRILDSRGQWTLEVSIQTNSGLITKASVPQGMSRGSGEAVYLPAEAAAQQVAELIDPALEGADIARQAEIDQKLIELDGTTNKSKLGANAILAVSLAVARAASVARRWPLWRHLRELADLNLDAERPPRLLVNVINGGAHAPGGLAIQEYLISPQTDSLAADVALAVEIYHALGAKLERQFGPDATRLGDEGGFTPPLNDDEAPFVLLQQVLAILKLAFPVKFGIDAAANNLNRPKEELFNLYRRLRQNFGLTYFEDPFAETDPEDFAKLLAEFGKEVLVVGDDLTVTDTARIKQLSAAKAINAVIIKPNQIGTVTETLDAVRAARAGGLAVIVSHRSGETNDDFVADLAWAMGADGIKLGAPARGERVAKYNRLLAIEQEAQQV